MGTFRRKILLKALKLFDLAALAGYFLFATWVTSQEMKGVSFERVLAMRIKASNLLIFIAFLLVWHGLFSFFKLYHSRRLTTRQEDMRQIFKAVSLGTLVLLLASIFFNIRLINGLFLDVFWGTAALGTIAARLILKYGLKKIRNRGRNLRNIVIVGTSSRALRFMDKVLNTPEFGYRIMGFVDEGSGMKSFEKSGHHLVADFNSLPALLRTAVIDEVVICLPIKSYYQQISQIVSDCEKQGILVRFPSDFFNLKLGRVRPKEHEEDAFITVSTGRMEGTPVLVKYVLDFIVSLILLIVLSPIFLAAALLIKMTSPGPVFFVQDRVGLHKRVFRLFKFRTMVADAEAKLAALEELNEVDGSGLQDQKRSPDHRHRKIFAKNQYRRAAAVDQRVERGDEPGRPQALTRSRLQWLRPGLAAPPLQRPTRNYLPLADQRPLQCLFFRVDENGYAIY